MNLCPKHNVPHISFPYHGTIILAHSLTSTNMKALFPELMVLLFLKPDRNISRTHPSKASSKKWHYTRYNVENSRKTDASRVLNTRIFQRRYLRCTDSKRGIVLLKDVWLHSQSLCRLLCVQVLLGSLYFTSREVVITTSGVLESLRSDRDGGAPSRN